MSRVISHRPSPTPPPVTDRIEDGVIYEDPSSTGLWQWFLGATVFNYKGESGPALIALSTGKVFTYFSGQLPGRLRKAAAGSLTISTEEE